MRLLQAATNDVWYNDDNKCEMPQMHSSQRPKPLQQILAEMEDSDLNF